MASWIYQIVIWTLLVLLVTDTIHVDGPGMSEEEARLRCMIEWADPGEKFSIQDCIHFYRGTGPTFGPLGSLHAVPKP